MTLLLTLLAVLAPATAERASPVNPLAGVSTDRVSLIRVREFYAPYRDHGPPLGLLDCVIDQAHAAPFAAAVARARPLRSQNRTTRIGYVVQVSLDNGRAIGVITTGLSSSGGFAGPSS